MVQLSINARVQLQREQFIVTTEKAFSYYQSDQVNTMYKY